MSTFDRSAEYAASNFMQIRNKTLKEKSSTAIFPIFFDVIHDNMYDGWCIGTSDSF